MDPDRNPFTPGAGIAPPVLAGRAEAVKHALWTLRRGIHGQHLCAVLFTGLRGVGKTVLLDELSHRARRMGYLVEKLDIAPGQRLDELLIPAVRRLLLAMDRPSRGATGAVKRGLRTLRSYMGPIGGPAGAWRGTLDIEPEPGTADTGDLSRDTLDLLVALGQAAKAAGKPVVLLLDELPHLARGHDVVLMRALDAVHHRHLPLVLLGSALPHVASHAGTAKPEIERVFAFVPLHPLTLAEATAALRGPLQREQVTISDDALVEMLTHTHGVPAFVQAWGYQAWHAARSGSIDETAARKATARALSQLDASFFAARFARATPVERAYLRYLAEAGGGDGPQRAADVAMRAQRTTNSFGPVRDTLIKKGLIYAPQHGTVAFTMPLFDAFLQRVVPR
jgi:hypothetical protein